MSIVTLPAFAGAELLSTLSCPLGSAESLTVPLAPLELGVVLVEVAAGAAGALDDVSLFLLLLPQPATASAATRATASTRTRFGFIVPPFGSSSRSAAPSATYAISARWVRLPVRRLSRRRALAGRAAASRCPTGAAPPRGGGTGPAWRPWSGARRRCRRRRRGTCRR